MEINEIGERGVNLSSAIGGIELDLSISSTPNVADSSRQCY